MSFSIITLFFFLLSPAAQAGKETTQSAVPNGWAAFPINYLGTHIHPVGDKGVRIDARPKGAKQGRVCMTTRQAVEGRVRIKGKWKRTGLIADAGWKGAAITIRFFNKNNKIVAPAYKGQNIVKAGNGTTGWQHFTKGFVVPSGATTAKLCMQIQGSFQGSAEFTNVRMMGTEAVANGNGKNVIFIVMDTLRADVLGVYGNKAGLTPHIDAFAKKSLTVDRAWTQYTWTTPSYVSYMTSQYARTHGWVYPWGDGTHLFHLGTGVLTLAEVLASQGYITTGISVNGRVDARISMDRGFEKWTGPSPDSVAVERVLEDLDLWRTDGAPNFLYTHFMTTHTPLSPSIEGQKTAKVSVHVPKGGVLYFKDAVKPESTEAKHQSMFRDAYMASVFDADRIIHSVIQGLNDRGLEDDTVIAVFSDHGELLGEHGLNGHGPHVYEQLTWIPLLVRAPWMKAGRLDDRMAGLIDLAPTVLHALDLEAETPSEWQGSSLYKPSTRSMMVSERGTLTAFSQDGVYKIIEGESLEAGFHILEDPDEETNLGFSHPAIAPLHQAALQWKTDTPKGSNNGPLLSLTTKEQSDEMEKLKALGYIE